MMSHLVIGSRGSKLALCQARWARDLLCERQSNLEIEIEVIRTKGDQVLGVPQARIKGKEDFTKEIEDALLDGRIDLAVHSLKDLPVDLPDGLKLGAVSRRVDIRDALVSRNGMRIAELVKGARIGTSSLRRQAQLRHLWPDLIIEDIRGNVDTRLQKLRSEGLDGVVLAAAGLLRLGLNDQVSEFFSPEKVLPAAGQGALGIEVRSEDAKVISLVSHLEDRIARFTVTAEREMLRVLGGGCRVAIGAWARMERNLLVLEGMVATTDGSQLLRGRSDGPFENPEKVGQELADQLILQGAKAILDFK